MTPPLSGYCRGSRPCFFLSPFTGYLAYNMVCYITLPTPITSNWAAKPLLYMNLVDREKTGGSNDLGSAPTRHFSGIFWNFSDLSNTYPIPKLNNIGFSNPISTWNALFKLSYVNSSPASPRTTQFGFVVSTSLNSCITPTTKPQ